MLDKGLNNVIEQTNLLPSKLIKPFFKNCLFLNKKNYAGNGKIVVAGVHLRSESEINVEGIFKERLPERTISLSRVAEIKIQRKLSEACPLYLIKQVRRAVSKEIIFYLGYS